MLTNIAFAKTGAQNDVNQEPTSKVFNDKIKREEREVDVSVLTHKIQQEIFQIKSKNNVDMFLEHDTIVMMFILGRKIATSQNHSNP